MLYNQKQQRDDVIISLPCYVCLQVIHMQYSSLLSLNCYHYLSDIIYNCMWIAVITSGDAVVIVKTINQATIVFHAFILSSLSPCQPLAKYLFGHTVQAIGILLFQLQIH